MTVCTYHVLVHYDIVVNPCRPMRVGCRALTVAVDAGFAVWAQACPLSWATRGGSEVAGAGSVALVILARYVERVTGGARGF